MKEFCFTVNLEMKISRLQTDMRNLHTTLWMLRTTKHFLHATNCWLQTIIGTLRTGFCKLQTTRNGHLAEFFTANHSAVSANLLLRATYKRLMYGT